MFNTKFFICKYSRGTHEYLWILQKYMDTCITDICTTMHTDMKRMFIQRIGYIWTNVRTLPALLILS